MNKVAEWGVYIIHCADDTLYTGITNHLTARIDAHNMGKGAKYTQTRRPVVVLYWEPCLNRSHASQREHQIKQLKRADKLLLIDQQTHEKSQNIPAQGPSIGLPD